MPPSYLLYLVRTLLRTCGTSALHAIALTYGFYKNWGNFAHYTLCENFYATLDIELYNKFANKNKISQTFHFLRHVVYIVAMFAGF